MAGINDNTSEIASAALTIIKIVDVSMGCLLLYLLQLFDERVKLIGQVSHASEALVIEVILFVNDCLVVNGFCHPDCHKNVVGFSHGSPFYLPTLASTRAVTTFFTLSRFRGSRRGNFGPRSTAAIAA